MRDCLSHQIDMMSAGNKPWLFFIKQLLNHSGLGFYFERDPLSFNHKLLVSSFQMRIENISRSDLLAEARTLRSLQPFEDIFEPSPDPQPYVRYNFSTRRLIGMLRLNLKYSLSFDHTDRCKLCAEACEPNERWNHILLPCHALPPLSTWSESSHLYYLLCINSGWD